MRPSMTKDYLPVNQRESGESSEDDEKSNEASSKNLNLRSILHSYRLGDSSWTAWTRWVPWILVLCLIVSNWYALAKRTTTAFPDAVFSPATSAIKYKNVVFHAGIDSDRSQYQGQPTEENNKLWEELHRYGVSSIPMSDASQLANRTSPISGEPGKYVVILDVFHQLHCLDHMRRRLFWNDPTTSPETVDALNMKHLDHCIESIRQSLMCSGDITPLPFQWWSRYGELSPVAAVTHTCRDFEALRDWAKENRVVHMDKTVHVKDPLGDEVVYDLH